MNLDAQGAGDQESADAARSSFRMMAWSGIAVMALGVVIIFLPSHNSHRVHQIAGIFVIVGGLCILGWATYFRRRLR
jgi:drug/metabolite transporter (DMT)-like permease